MSYKCQLITTWTLVLSFNIQQEDFLQKVTDADYADDLALFSDDQEIYVLEVLCLLQLGYS